MLNYIGPNDGQEMKIYYDGTQIESDTTKFPGTLSAGDGRIVVGRRYTNTDYHYASVRVDELIFFNQALTQQEITALAAAT